MQYAAAAIAARWPTRSRAKSRRPTPATARCVRAAAACCGSRRATNSGCCAARADLTTYTFNKHVIQHRFCKHCGIQSFALGKDPRGNEMAAINIRCLEDFEFDNVPVQHIDGKAF